MIKRGLVLVLPWSTPLANLAFIILVVVLLLVVEVLTLLVLRLLKQQKVHAVHLAATWTIGKKCSRHIFSP
jgi:hypothetical protein